jgi:hypothetical protein
LEALLEGGNWIAVAALVVEAIRDILIAYINYLERSRRDGVSRTADVDRSNPR